MSEDIDLEALLLAALRGDLKAEAELFQIVYFDIRRRAQVLLRSEVNPITLGSGTLVHEAFLKLFRSGSLPHNVHGQAHFFALAVRAMKQVIVDHARTRVAAIHGGRLRQVQLDSIDVPVPQDFGNIEDVLTISDACDRMAVSKPKWAQVIELRFFGGLTNVEIADLLGVATATVDKRLTTAKAFLRRELLSEQTIDVS